MKTFHWLDYLTHLELLVIITALLVVSYPSEADEVYLGLRTYHFDRSGRDCLNETHNLVGYSKNDYYVGTYVNSQCSRSYLVGMSEDFKHGFGFDISAVTGYPKSMQLVESLVFIPSATYKKYWGHTGVKLIYIPTVLVGIGLAIKY